MPEIIERQPADPVLAGQKKVRAATSAAVPIGPPIST
jgi:hypothetical protein